MADLTRAALLAKLAEAIDGADGREYPDSPLTVEAMAEAALDEIELYFELPGLADN